MSRRHHYGGLAFFAILAASWVVGLFGLERGRVDSLQLLLVALGGFLVYGIAVIIRRHHEVARDRVLPSMTYTPRTCVVIRRFGADEQCSLPTQGVALPVRKMELVIAEPASQTAARHPERKAGPARRGYIPIAGS